MHADKKIIAGIAANDSKTIRTVYNEIYPQVESLVLFNGGTTEDARDVFQDAMVIVLNKVGKKDFILQCKFSTYLYAICKNLWVQDRKKHYSRQEKLREVPMVAEDPPPYGMDEDDEDRQLFLKHFNKLGPDCRRMLSMYFNGMTIEEIRKEMGMQSLHHVSDKKYRCKKDLIDRIMADPLFKKLKK